MATSKQTTTRSKSRKKPAKKPVAPIMAATPGKQSAIIQVEPQEVELPKKGLRRVFSREKKPLVPPSRLPASWLVAKKAMTLLWEHRIIFLGITVIYATLNILLVGGLAAAADMTQYKNLLHTSHGTSHLVAGLSLFSVLVVTSSKNISQVAGAYQMFLVIITSLALIWSLRKVKAGETIRIRDAFYKGMYPLIPVTLVLLIVLLQCLPLIIGAALYGTITANGIAVTLVEKILCAVIFFGFTLWTLYWLSSSLFAIYIVTLPDMTPIKALRSARTLVRFRRWSVLRKLLFLPLGLLLVSALIIVPIALTITAAAQWAFFLLSMFVIAIFHSYMYTLYRELLA